MYCNLRDVIVQGLQCNTKLHRGQKCGICSRLLLLLHLSKGDGAHQETGMAKETPKTRKKKTNPKPLRENPADSDPNPQLSCHKAAAGIGGEARWEEAAGPAQCLYNTLLQNCVQ